MSQIDLARPVLGNLLAPLKTKRRVEAGDKVRLELRILHVSRSTSVSYGCHQVLDGNGKLSEVSVVDCDGWESLDLGDQGLDDDVGAAIRHLQCLYDGRDIVRQGEERVHHGPGCSLQAALQAGKVFCV